MFEILIRYGDGAFERIGGFRSRGAASAEIRRMLRVEGHEILWARVEETGD